MTLPLAVWVVLGCVLFLAGIAIGVGYGLGEKWRNESPPPSQNQAPVGKCKGRCMPWW